MTDAWFLPRGSIQFKSTAMFPFSTQPGTGLTKEFRITAQALVAGVRAVTTEFSLLVGHLHYVAATVIKQYTFETH